MKWQGKGVSEGLAMAQIHLFTPKLPEISRQPAADAEAEVAKLEATLAAAEEELRGLYETAKEKMGEQEAEIFDAHLTILGDEYSVREPIIQRIREQKQNAAAAITDQFDELAQMFRSLGDELMAERAADAEDLKQQLLRICLGCGRQDLSVLPGDVIVLAEELTPSAPYFMACCASCGVPMFAQISSAAPSFVCEGQVRKASSACASQSACALRL